MTVSEFARQAVENDEWPKPVPFDQYSSLPDFPVEALPGIGREMIEAVSKVNQVDPALAACLYFGALSTCLSKKAKVNLLSHEEPMNLYLCPVSNSGTRKSSTTSDIAGPLYEYETARRDKLSATISDAYNAYKIRENRLEKLQKKAAKDNPIERASIEEEAREEARWLSENPIPTLPTYLVDDVTPEKLGVLMAENGECMAVLSPEGGLFEIMAGRYSKDGVGNIELFLKAHAGDPWSNHRIGREEKRMESPALTLCLAVQAGVIEEIGKNARFREKGLLARFLFSLCESHVGYRGRQTDSIPVPLRQSYRSHVFSLMDIPVTAASLRLSQEAQAVWDEFYNDAEREMRPEGSLYYLQDWGSKLPGAAARIAGLLHLAEHGMNGLSLPISVNIVTASCAIGAYFKEHAIAVFGMMQEDLKIKLARQLLDYIRRIEPETFTGRDVMHHTSIGLMEDVDLGVKVLLDRGYIRGEDAVNELTDNRGPGRPKAKGYRVNPKTFDRKNA
jgi:replicative DNA helicase